MRLRLFSALLIVALFLNVNTTHAASASTHGCAPPIPPPVPGSPVAAPATPGIVLINEVLSMPGSSWNCSELNKTFSLKSDSWVELYNRQNQPYNLYAAHASFDSGPNTLTYYLPFGAAIAAHSYLVIFPEVYSSIHLSAGSLRLVIAGTTIDEVNIPALPTDHSYARVPDGSNNWQITNTPTIDASNMVSQVSPTPTSSSSSLPNLGSGGYVKATSTPTIISSTQPAWSNLQFSTPVAAVTSTTDLTSPTLTTSPTSSTSTISNGWDTSHRILLTVLAVALALMLFWCWRLFSSVFRKLDK